MAYVELAGGVWMLGATAFIDASNGMSRLVLKAPLPTFGALMAADALARLGWLNI